MPLPGMYDARRRHRLRRPPAAPAAACFEAAKAARRPRPSASTPTSTTTADPAVQDVDHDLDAEEGGRRGLRLHLKVVRRRRSPPARTTYDLNVDGVGLLRPAVARSTTSRPSSTTFKAADHRRRDHGSDHSTTGSDTTQPDRVRGDGSVSRAPVYIRDVTGLRRTQCRVSMERVLAPPGSAAPGTADAAVELRGITKRFPGVVANRRHQHRRTPRHQSTPSSARTAPASRR